MHHRLVVEVAEFYSQEWDEGFSKQGGPQRIIGMDAFEGAVNGVGIVTPRWFMAERQPDGSGDDYDGV